MDAKNLIKEYTNGEVTIVWKPAACVHSTICWKESTGLPQVFNPRERPWIKPENATTEQMVAQVKKCPSGALSYYYNNGKEDEKASDTEAKVEVIKNGPLLVYGPIHVKDQNGIETKKENVTAFCRCGLSTDKPYCDGSHITTKVDG